ncbi:MAG TPA: hypothetical protein DEH78_23285 [Solibacterales bacterium]|nr:hypothetical protein [Bryobacterales bacterium]
MRVLVLGPLHTDVAPHLFALTGTDTFDFDQLAPGAYRIGVQMPDQVAAPWLNSANSTGKAIVVAGKVTSTVVPVEAR